jgi:class 3 adenylate cyclase/tetratricopeptide (TPR) repeat protein
VRTCGQCGEGNPGHARFCLGCGTPLASQDRSAGESRKVVTVLFCDVVGSTGVAEGLDPESVREMFSRYFAQARRVIEHNGGTVEKFIGDAVVGAFGVPMLHEDDAYRGIRAAVQLRDAVAELNAQFELRWGLEIGVRIGVNTGEVVAGNPALGQAFVSGDAVNVAARLEQAAASGEILIGDDTRRLARDRVCVEPVGSLELKGRAASAEAWRVLAVRAPSTSAPPPLTSVMVGRNAELEQLKSSFETVVSRRTCRLATVIGAPGVGKSRLVSEFTTWLAADAALARGRCLPYGEGITFWPVAEAIRDLAGVESSEDRGAARARLEALSPDGGLSPSAIDVTLGVLGLAPVAAREETYWAVRSVLEAVAAQRPVVLVLEDLHWGEATLIDFVEHLPQWSADVPILVLVAARPELQLIRPSLLARGPDRDCLRLESLGEHECRRLAAELVGGAVDRDLVDQVVRAAEGNPLFVAEILRMLVDDGVLQPDGDVWRRADAPTPLAVPTTIQALLSARLDRLAAGERSVIERASVVGKQFIRGALRELSAPSVGERLDDHLAVLIARELVTPDEQAWLGEDTYRFSHLLIRDAAYQRLLKHERARLHERLAGWLEAQPDGQHGVEHEDLIGYHLEQAHLYHRQLGRLDEHGRDLGRRAATYLLATGRRALARGDHPAATNLLERAGRLLPDGDPARLEILLDLAECAVAAGHPSRATGALDLIGTTRADARFGPVEAAQVSVARCEVRLLSDPDRLRSDVAVLRGAIATLTSAGVPAGPGLTRAHTVLGRSLAFLGRLGEAERELDLALVAARKDGDAVRARQVLLHLPLVALWGPLPVTRANGRLIDTLRILRLRPGNRMVEAEVLRCMALLEAMRGRLDAARTVLGSAQQMFTELGSVVGLGESSLSMGMIDLMAGDPARASDRLQEAHERFSSAAATAGAGRAAAWLSEAYYRQGDWDLARRWSGVADGGSTGTGTGTRWDAVWQAVQAKLAARDGRTTQAEAQARRAVKLVEGTDALVDRADALLSLGEVLRLSGRVADAEELGHAAAALYDAKGHVIGSAYAIASR